MRIYNNNFYHNIYFIIIYYKINMANKTKKTKRAYLLRKRKLSKSKSKSKSVRKTTYKKNLFSKLNIFKLFNNKKRRSNRRSKRRFKRRSNKNQKGG